MLYAYLCICIILHKFKKENESLKTIIVSVSSLYCSYIKIKNLKYLVKVQIHYIFTYHSDLLSNSFKNKNISST